jgi:hypothetical protein
MPTMVLDGLDDWGCGLVLSWLWYHGALAIALGGMSFLELAHMEDGCKHTAY